MPSIAHRSPVAVAAQPAVLVENLGHHHLIHPHPRRLREAEVKEVKEIKEEAEVKEVRTRKEAKEAREARKEENTLELSRMNGSRDGMQEAGKEPRTPFGRTNGKRRRIREEQRQEEPRRCQ